MRRKIDLSFIKNFINDKKPDYEYISGEIKNQKSFIEVKHIPCGFVYITQVKGFISERENNKGNCKVCNPIKNFKRTIKLTELDIINRFKSVTNGEYVYQAGFINSKSKMEVLHSKCNTVFNVTSHMFFGTKQTRCPHCANHKRKSFQSVNRKEDYLTNILINNGLDKDYYWLEEYTGDNKYKHLIFHKVCGERSLARPNDIQQGYLPCTCEGSKYEVKFKNLLIKYQIPFTREFKLGNSMRVDFVVQCKNSRIFIEIDGEFHDRIQESKKLDLIKENIIEEKFPKDYFIRIRYDEDFETIVKEMKSNLNKL
jgi:very-short-patch-repair endonuclease